MQGDNKDHQSNDGQQISVADLRSVSTKQSWVKKYTNRAAVCRFVRTHKRKVIATSVVTLIIVVALAVWFGTHIKNNETMVSKNPAIVRYQEQLPALKEEVQKNPKNGDAHKNYAVALYATGDLKQARGQYEEAAKLSDNDATIQNNLGNVYRDLGMADRAVAAYKRAVELNPKAINSYVNLANVQLYTQDDAGAAIETYRAALQALPGNNHAELLLAIAYEEKNDIPSARRAYENILRRDGDNVAAKAGLERLNS